jgi:hypothetical protein
VKATPPPACPLRRHTAGVKATPPPFTPAPKAHGRPFSKTCTVPHLCGARDLSNTYWVLPKPTEGISGALPVPARARDSGTR